jgi:hypothetical protein
MSTYFVYELSLGAINYLYTTKQDKPTEAHRIQKMNKKYKIYFGEGKVATECKLLTCFTATDRYDAMEYCETFDKERKNKIFSLDDDVPIKSAEELAAEEMINSLNLLEAKEGVLEKERTRKQTLVVCECGYQTSLGNMLRHKESKYHEMLMSGEIGQEFAETIVDPRVTEHRRKMAEKKREKDRVRAAEVIQCEECDYSVARSGMTYHKTSKLHYKMLKIKQDKIRLAEALSECGECDTESNDSASASTASSSNSSTTSSTTATEILDDCVFFCDACGVTTPPAYRELHLASPGHRMVQVFIANLQDDVLVE